MATCGECQSIQYPSATWPQIVSQATPGPAKILTYVSSFDSSCVLRWIFHTVVRAVRRIPRRA
jgi:hypothetical protein